MLCTAICVYLSFIIFSLLVYLGGMGYTLNCVKCMYINIVICISFYPLDYF